MGSLPEETPEVIAERTSHVQALMDRLRASNGIYGLVLPTMTLTSVTRGTVLARLVLEPIHLNSKGGLHGAVSATIIDFTTGLAICSWDLRPVTGASVDMNITYLSTAGEGDMIEVEAKAERVGGSLSFVGIRIVKVGENGEKTVVTLGQHTKYLRPKPKTEA